MIKWNKREFRKANNSLPRREEEEEIERERVGRKEDERRWEEFRRKLGMQEEVFLLKRGSSAGRKNVVPWEAPNH